MPPAPAPAPVGRASPPRHLIHSLQLAAGTSSYLLQPLLIKHLHASPVYIGALCATATTELLFTLPSTLIYSTARYAPACMPSIYKIAPCTTATELLPLGHVYSLDPPHRYRRHKGKGHIFLPSHHACMHSCVRLPEDHPRFSSGICTSRLLQLSSRRRPLKSSWA